jgi:MbtH protein
VLTDGDKDKPLYRAVVNHEEQCSIWSADRNNSLEWRDAGKIGTKANCLKYIGEVWTEQAAPIVVRSKQMLVVLGLKSRQSIFAPCKTEFDGISTRHIVSAL